VETLSRSAQEAVRQATLKMGPNILIIPRGAPRDRLWTAQFGEFEMPEEVLEDLARNRQIEVDHYAARLERRVRIGEVLAILTGVRDVPVTTDRGEIQDLRFEFGGPQEVHLGATAARCLGKNVGDTISLEGRTFTIARVRPEHGTADDIRIYVDLHAMQAMYGKPGRIDSIAALGRFRRGTREPLKTVKDQLERQLGDRGEVIVARVPFEARDKSRRMLETVGSALAAILLVLAGLGLALYIHHNASERRYEVAVLVALGYRPWQVTMAMLSKVAAVGMAAAVGGLLAGTAIAVAAGPGILAVEAVRPVWALWWQALGFALLLCVAAAAVAVWGALRAAPAEVLRNK